VDFSDSHCMSSFSTLILLVGSFDL